MVWRGWAGRGDGIGGIGTAGFHHHHNCNSRASVNLLPQRTTRAMAATQAPGATVYRGWRLEAFQCTRSDSGEVTGVQDLRIRGSRFRVQDGRKFRRASSAFRTCGERWCGVWAVRTTTPHVLRRSRAFTTITTPYRHHEHHEHATTHSRAPPPHIHATLRAYNATEFFPSKFLGCCHDGDTVLDAAGTPAADSTG